MVVNGTVGPDGSVPVDQLPVGNYTVEWTTVVDGNYTPATNTSTISVLPIPTEVSIGNVTTYPGEDVTIPVIVTIRDNEPFTGKVDVIMPDNTTISVDVINGTGNVTWHVPEDYTPNTYEDIIKFPESDIYVPSNSTGIIEVVKIPTHIVVGNVTTFAGMEVTIPINVSADDGKQFNGNVTIILPDGSNKTVEIINGTGNVKWFVPEDYSPDKYPDTVRFAGDDRFLPSEGNGTITVVKVPVDVIVGNVTAKPCEDVTIPINVVPQDGSTFNGNVTVELPDGTKKVVEIINGTGSVDWTVPQDYDGDYLVKVTFDGTNIYYPSNGTGIITVIPDKVVPQDTNQSTIPNEVVKVETNSKATGNPILVLLAVLALLGIGIKRRK